MCIYSMYCSHARARTPCTNNNSGLYVYRYVLYYITKTLKTGARARSLEPNNEPMKNSTFAQYIKGYYAILPVLRRHRNRTVQTIILLLYNNILLPCRGIRHFARVSLNSAMVVAKVFSRYRGGRERRVCSRPFSGHPARLKGHLCPRVHSRIIHIHVQ